MTQIRTAEEILKAHGLVREGCSTLIISTEDGKEHNMNEIMIEYAKQFIDLAAEDAKNGLSAMKYSANLAPNDLYQDGYIKAIIGATACIDESILKLKERVK